MGRPTTAAWARLSGLWTGACADLLASSPAWEARSPEQLLACLADPHHAAPTPGQPLIGVAGYSSLNRYNWPADKLARGGHTFFYAARFEDLRPLPVVRQAETPVAISPGSSFKPVWRFEDYRERFDRVQALIQAGDCYQINLAQRFDLQPGPPRSVDLVSPQLSASQVFQQLSQRIEAPWAGCLSTPHGSVLSCSPEHFLSIEADGEMITHPIKGTRPRHAVAQRDQAAAEALVNSEKDRAENLMIVDLLRNDLGRIARAGTVRTPELFRLTSFSNVHHLVSTVQAQVKAGLHPLDALFRCLPGGSITGAPKLRAMQIIEDLEEGDRGPYCGTMFFYDGQRLTSNILIRTLWMHQDALTLWGGGGIVADSVCETEYNETLVKINHIIEALNCPPLPLRPEPERR